MPIGLLAWMIFLGLCVYGYWYFLILILIIPAGILLQMFVAWFCLEVGNWINRKRGKGPQLRTH